MAKKNNKSELKQIPRKWAREENIDPMVFDYWKDVLMTQEEFNKIKEKICRRK